MTGPQFMNRTHGSMIKSKCKRNLIVVGACVGLLFTALPLHAGESGASVEPHKNSVVLGLDVGLGASHFTGGNDQLNLVSGFKAGAGVREDLLLLFEIASVRGVGSSSNMQEYLFAVQFFPLEEGIYVRSGFGLGSAREVSFRRGYGIAGGTAVGYEWRIKKKFAFSPEFQLGYVRDRGNNFAYGLAMDFRWYF